MPPDYVTFTLSGPAFSFGASFSRNGTLFFNPGSGGVNPVPGMCLSIGVLPKRPADPAQIDQFLYQWSSQFNYGTLGMGYGNGFSSGESSQVLNFGTPAFPGGSVSYGQPVFNVLGRSMPK